MQVSGDTISFILNLVNRFSLLDYLIKIYQEKSELIKKRYGINLYLSIFLSKVNFSDSFLKNVENRLNALNDEYVELLIRNWEMSRENNVTLSRALGSPHKTRSLSTGNSILIILLSILTWGFVAAVMALILPYKDA